MHELPPVTAAPVLDRVGAILVERVGYVHPDDSILKKRSYFEGQLKDLDKLLKSR